MLFYVGVVRPVQKKSGFMPRTIFEADQQRGGWIWKSWQLQNETKKQRLRSWTMCTALLVSLHRGVLYQVWGRPSSAEALMQTLCLQVCCRNLIRVVDAVFLTSSAEDLHFGLSVTPHGHWEHWLYFYANIVINQAAAFLSMVIICFLNTSGYKWICNLL